MKKLKEKIAIHREDGECGCKYSEEGYSCVNEAEAFNDGMKAYKDFLPNLKELKLMIESGVWERHEGCECKPNEYKEFPEECCYLYCAKQILKRIGKNE